MTVKCHRQVWYDLTEMITSRRTSERVGTTSEREVTYPRSGINTYDKLWARTVLLIYSCVGVKISDLARELARGGYSRVGVDRLNSRLSR